MQYVLRISTVAMSLAITASTAWAAELRFDEGAARCSVLLETQPPLGEVAPEPFKTDESARESTGGYRVQLQRQEADGHARWTVHLERADGGAFRIIDYRYACRVPLGRVVAVFDTQVPAGPSMFRQAPRIDVSLTVRPNQGIPYMAACDHYGRNSLAVGPIDQTGTYRMIGQRDGDDYTITFARDEYAGDGWFSGKEFSDAVFVSTRNSEWFDTARAFADTVDQASGYEPRPIPEQATRPYYSTWYAYSNEINDQIVWDNARIASRIGIGNFVIFIGWSTCADWFNEANEWGDYTACTSRFADFANLVRRIRDDLGMGVEIWVAPTWIGQGSEAFKTMQEYRSKWPNGGYDRNLDPRSPQARAHIRRQFAGLAERYGVTGVYMDFLDTVYNRNDARHEKSPRLFGPAYEQYLEACYEGLSAEVDAPLVAFRTPFANLLSKHHASTFATTYTDGDWDRSRLLAIGLRPFSRGVSLRGDPLTWTREEFDDRELVGKSLSAMMFCGVPGISIDLTRLDDKRLKNLADWFSFYNRHREDLLNGEFRPFGREFHYPEMLIHRGQTAYAWVSRLETDLIPLPHDTTHAFIFTHVPRDESFIARLDINHVEGLRPGRYRAQWFNSELESHDGPFELVVRPQETRPAAPRLPKSARENWDFHPDEHRPSLDVRRGGYLELEWLAP